jgi:hypothetical protein
VLCTIACAVILFFPHHRCVHSVSEAQRVSTFDSAGLQPVTVAKTSTNSTELLVVAGHAGSGIGLITAHLARQLADGRPSGSTVQHAMLDFTAFSADLPLNTFVDTAITGAEVLSGASAAAAGAAPPAILVSVVVSAENHLSLPLLVTFVGAQAASVIQHGAVCYGACCR